MEILEPKKKTIYGKEYFCYGPSLTEENINKNDYYRNQYDNFKYSKDFSLLSEEKTPNFRRCNICNITSMIMCLKLMRIVLPQEPKYNSDNVALTREEEKLAQFMYSSGRTDPTNPEQLVKGTNLWLKKEISGSLSVKENEQKNAIKDLLIGLPVLISGYFFNTLIKDGKGEPHVEVKSGGIYKSIKVDGKGEEINGVEGHYVCVSAIAFKEEYKEGAEPDFYQIQDPYAETFSNKEQIWPYTEGKEKGTTGKDVWITKEQFKKVFSPRKDTKDCRSIRFTNNAAVISEEWAEFSNIITLPDLLNNYNPNGWFSKDAVTSYMYSSGYKKIDGKYPGLVKIFEDDSAGNVEGFSEIDGKDGKYDLSKIEKRSIDNLSCERFTKKLFEGYGKNLIDYFSKKSNRFYFVGNKGEYDIETENLTPLEGPIKTIIRYPHIIENNNVARFFTNFLDKETGEGYVISGFYLQAYLKSENKEKTINQKIPNITKSNGDYIDLKKIFAIASYYTNTVKREEWLTSEDINKLKSLNNENVGTFTNSVGSNLDFNKKYLFSIIYELRQKFLGLKTDETNKLVYKLIEIFSLCDNEQKWLMLFSEIIYFGVYGNSLFGDNSFIKKEYSPKITFNNEKEYWPKTKEQYKELQNAITEINKSYNKFVGFTNDNIYYYGENEIHRQSLFGFPIKNFGDAMKPVRVDDGITEIATPIKKSDIFSKDPENYILKGVRIYFDYELGSKSKNENKKQSLWKTLLKSDKKEGDIYNFDTYLKTPLTKTGIKSIKEISFYFRYDKKGDSNNKRLYRYTVSLKKYENVINLKTKKEAAYFIPFLCDLNQINNKEYEYLFCEAFYENIEEKDLEKMIQPAIIKPYLQFGDFSGDLLNINQTENSNKQTKTIVTASESNVDESINEEYDFNKDIIKCCVYNTGEKNSPEDNYSLYVEPPYGFKNSNISAKDLKEKNVVFGCFSLNPPDTINKKSEWADCTNSNAKDVSLKSIVKVFNNQKDIYKYTLRFIEDKDGQETIYDFGKIDPENLKKLINLDGKKLKFNKFKYYTGYGTGEELTDYPYDPVNYGNYKTIAAPYNAGEHLFVAELQYGFNTNKEQLFGKKENLTNDEKMQIKWIPDIINCTINGNRITSIGRKDEIKSLNTNRGEKGTPALFENVSSNMINGLANLLGERISLCKTANAEDCNMYINEFGYLVHGYGMSYSLSCHTEKNEIKKQFEKFIEANKNKGNLFNIGKEYAVIKNPVKTLTSMSEGEKLEYKSKVDIGAEKIGAKKEEVYIQGKPVLRNVLDGYKVSKTEARKLLKKYISDINIGKVINCLKSWQLALDGKGNFSQEQIEKSYNQNFYLFEEKTIGKINQEAYETLVIMAFFEEEFESIQRCICSIIKEEVDGRELTNEQQKDVFENSFKEYLNDHVNKNSNLDKYAIKNYKLKELLLSKKDCFTIITAPSENKLGEKFTDKKLTIELTCTAVTGGILSSVMGGGFNKLAQKE